MLKKYHGINQCFRKIWFAYYLIKYKFICCKLKSKVNIYVDSIIFSVVAGLFKNKLIVTFLNKNHFFFKSKDSKILLVQVTYFSDKKYIISYHL